MKEDKIQKIQDLKLETEALATISHVLNILDGLTKRQCVTFTGTVILHDETAYWPTVGVSVAFDGTQGEEGTHILTGISRLDG